MRGKRHLRHIDIIGPRCRESFLPIHQPAGKTLAAHGIKGAGISDLRPKYRLNRPYIEGKRYHVLFFCYGGSAELYTPESDYVVNEGELLVIPAGVSYILELKAPRWQTVWFDIKDDGKWKKIMGNKVALRKTRYMMQIKHEMEEFLAESKVHGKSNMLITDLLSELIIRYIMLELCPKGMHVRPPEPFERIWHQVDQELKRKWKLEELARCVHMSSRNFTRQIQKYYQCSPMKMVSNLRLERAKEYLRNTDYKLAYIGNVVGFEGPYIFSAAFKRYTGLSPLEFRKTYGMFNS